MSFDISFSSERRQFPETFGNAFFSFYAQAQVRKLAAGAAPGPRERAGKKHSCPIRPVQGKLLLAQHLGRANVQEKSIPARSGPRKENCCCRSTWAARKDSETDRYQLDFFFNLCYTGTQVSCGSWFCRIFIRKLSRNMGHGGLQ